MTAKSFNFPTTLKLGAMRFYVLPRQREEIDRPFARLRIQRAVLACAMIKHEAEWTARRWAEVAK